MATTVATLGACTVTTVTGMTRTFEEKSRKLPPPSAERWTSTPTAPVPPEFTMLELADRILQLVRSSWSAIDRSLSWDLAD